MKIGDIVTHPNLKGRQRILSISHPIVTCEQIDEPMIWYPAFGHHKYERFVCHIENLTPYNEPEKSNEPIQTTLF